jgi:hypothetical protein
VQTFGPGLECVVFKPESDMGRLLAVLGLLPTRQPTVVTADATGGVPHGLGPVRVADAGPDDPDHGFSAAIALVGTQLDALKRHPQQARVQTAINEISTLLTQARDAAAKGNAAAASTLLQQARDKLGEAQTLANYFIEYVKARTALEAMSQALQGIEDPTLQQVVDDELKRIDTIAYGSPPKPIAGIVELKKSSTLLLKVLQPLIDEVKRVRTALQAKSAALRAFAASDLSQVDKLIDQINQGVASNTWGLVVMAGARAMEILPPTAHMMERRESFDDQRRKTNEAIARVKSLPAVKDSAVPLLEALVRQADTLATPREMGFDAAMQMLQQAADRSEAWVTIAPSVGNFDKLRADALREAAALAKDPAAKALAPQLAAVNKLISDAAFEVATTGASGGPADPAAAYGKALAGMNRATVELARLKDLAQGLGPVLAAQAAGQDPKDLSGLKNSLAALRLEADRAAKAPFAADAADELRRFTAATAQADAALVKSDGKTALARLGEAAQRLAAARRIQVQRGQFDATLARVEARRKALDSLATAALLKAKLAPVDAALDAARAKVKVPDGSAALAALQRADDAALAVEQADRDRRQFDGEAKSVDSLVKAVTDPKLRGELAAQAKTAQAQAGKFRFEDAVKALAAIKVRIDEATVRSLSASKPDDPALPAAAERMMKNGGAAALEKLIDDFPATGSAKAMTAIAKARHGIEFTLDAWSAQPGEIKALKVISKVLAKLPAQDTKSGPSLRRLTHTDAESGENEFVARTATIDLSSAAGGADKQRFGADLKADGSNKPQLPNIERDYRPPNDAPVERLNWATLHEVGHGLDDKHRFMSGHEQDPKYGNWKTYGTDVKPIADAVAASFGFDTTAEQRQYVLDLIQNTPTVPPPEPKAAQGSGLAWEDLRKSIVHWRELAGRPHVYKDQGACDSLAVGDTIYHESYPRIWVSYLASERKKGLTGYQFRSPGEWFAELYAGYRSGKLGPRHPALEWLKKIAP